MTRRTLTRIGFGVLVLLLATVATIAGCIGWRVPVVPVPSVLVRAPGDAPLSERVLVIFLPGSRDTPEEILEQGFAAKLHEQGILADVLAVDLHTGYYTGGRFDERLRVDIVEPMRARGYRAVWLAGISLGGFGSMMYAKAQPQHVDGIVALAPFVASNRVLEEVRAAGGIATWNEPVVDGDWQRDLLRWLKGYGDPQAKRPPLYVGYGSEDGFAEFNAAVGAVLPPGHVRVAPGGHDWPPWKQLWSEFANQVPWPRDSARGS
jgi:pimeloyl-ACP methyl ester carboxylesterase